MDDAQALEDQGEPEGSLVWAGEQTAGRGRHPGRVWLGRPGASLMFTVWWSAARFRFVDFAPSLTVGLGVCLWLESLGIGSQLPVALKWPNDVYLADRKAAGLLVRRKLGQPGQPTIHAGIGINLGFQEADQDFRTPAASLSEAGVRLSPQRALETLLPELEKALSHSDPRGACEQRLWRNNKEMELTLPGAVSSACGTVRGLDEFGRLLWDGPDGLAAVSSGE